jgi:hypothetical protein
LHPLTSVKLHNTQKPKNAMISIKYRSYKGKLGPNFCLCTSVGMEAFVHIFVQGPHGAKPGSILKEKNYFLAQHYLADVRVWHYKMIGARGSRTPLNDIP